jgi:hypothetical protein
MSQMSQNSDYDEGTVDINQTELNEFRQQLMSQSWQQVLQTAAETMTLQDRLRILKEVLKIKLVEHFETFENFELHKREIMTEIASGLHPNYSALEEEYEQFKGKHNLSEEDAAKRKKLKNNLNAIRLQAKRTYVNVVTDTFPDSALPAVVPSPQATSLLSPEPSLARLSLATPESVGEGFGKMIDFTAYIDEPPTFNPYSDSHRWPVPFRQLIVGAGGGGKTNTFLNELLLFNPPNKPPTFEPSHIFIITTTPEQPFYRFLRNSYSQVTFLSPDCLPELDEFEKQTATNYLICFDDCMGCDKSIMNKIVEYFIRGRHFGFSCVFITQYYASGEPKIRTNCSIITLIGYVDDNNMKQIINDCCAGVDRALVYQMKDKAYSVPFTPFVIMKEKQPAARFRNGLLELFPVPPPTPTIPATPISSRTPSTRLSNSPATPMLLSPPAVAPSQSSTGSKLTQWGNRSQRMNQDGFDTQDLYETPPRLVEVILPFLEVFKGKGKIWEACAGGFMIVDCLRTHGFDVLATDLFTIPDNHFDFLKVL